MITLDQLKEKCPAAFAVQPHPKMSGRYHFASTAKFVSDLIEKHGWIITNAAQSKHRKDDLRNTSKHIIRMRPTDVRSFDPALGDPIPEVVLVNSHNGASTWSAIMGMLRLVCTNGLVTSTGFDQDMSLPIIVKSCVLLLTICI